MWPDQVSNPGPQTYESGALPTGLVIPKLSLLPLLIWGTVDYIFLINLSLFSVQRCCKGRPPEFPSGLNYPSLMMSQINHSWKNGESM